MSSRDTVIQKKDVEKSFGHAAKTYDQAAFLQREIADRLDERLDLMKLSPERVLDLGCGTGYSLPALQKRYPKAKLFGADLAHPMLNQAKKRKISWFNKPQFIQADADSLPFADQSFDLIFSNFALQWCQSLEQTFAELHRVLKPEGLLLFTTFGPDTLKELKSAWSMVDDKQHVNDFIDMHDVGDCLLQAGFLDPVMDAETITMNYATVRDLLKELKTIGAHNVNSGRSRGLTGKGKFKRFEVAYSHFQNQKNQFPASYEVVYGHAWARKQQPSTGKKINIRQVD